MKRFLGNDWTELAEAWGCSTDCEEHVNLLFAQQKLKRALGDKDKCKIIAKDIRAYLKALIKSNSYGCDNSLWQGLIGIRGKDAGYDETLIQYTRILLTSMWS